MGTAVFEPPQCSVHARPQRQTNRTNSSVEKWQGLRDSNPRPSVLETDALPTELNPYAGGWGSRNCAQDQEAITLRARKSAENHEATSRLSTKFSFRTTPLSQRCRTFAASNLTPPPRISTEYEQGLKTLPSHPQGIPAFLIDQASTAANASTSPAMILASFCRITSIGQSHQAIA